MDSLHLDDKKEETVYLYTGSDYGVFMSSKVAKADEIEANIERQMRSGSITITSDMVTDFNKTFYKDLQAGTVKTVEDIASKDYIYTEPKTPSWQIGDSTKTFSDYTVQKATTRFAGRDYVAWFTMEIPIPDGPYLFHGLPGLIVALYDTSNDYHFKLKSIQKLDKPRIWKIPEAKRIDKAKFKKLQAKAAKHKRFNQTEIGGMTITILDENGNNSSSAKMRRKNKERMARENNPIELK
jgi:GLPGLI family protein